MHSLVLLLQSHKITEPTEGIKTLIRATRHLHRGAKLIANTVHSAFTMMDFLNETPQCGVWILSIKKGKSALLTNVSSYFFSQRYFVVPDSVQDLSPHSPEIPEEKKMPLNAKLFNSLGQSRPTGGKA